MLERNEGKQIIVIEKHKFGQAFVRRIIVHISTGTLKIVRQLDAILAQKDYRFFLKNW